VLYEFLIANREEILAHSRAKRRARMPTTTTTTTTTNAKTELAGLPLFMDQLIAVLRSEKPDRGPAFRDVSESAALHGGALLRLGLTVGEVVHDYGSICQSVTQLAHERGAAIAADEFQTLNRCLDDAIAEAVTAFERQRDQTVGGAGVERLGSLAHEMRNLLGGAMLSFDALSTGRVGARGSTSALHGRTLQRMRILIDRTLAEVRLEAGTHRAERVSVAEVIEEIEMIATIEANDRDIRLSVDGGSADVVVEADPQILASVVANLVQNAFKFTRARGHITLRAHTAGDRVLIDVQDECGGLPPGRAEDLFRPFEQRSADKTGMGLGLSISLRGVQAIGGEIRVRDLPGTGCIFTVDVPRAPSERP
jgi:signal transduction histidine kinase